MDVQLGGVPLGAAGFDLRQVEDLVDQPRQPLRFVDDDGEEPLPLRQVDIGIVEEDLGEGPDCSGQIGRMRDSVDVMDSRTRVTPRNWLPDLGSNQGPTD